MKIIISVIFFALTVTICLSQEKPSTAPDLVAKIKTIDVKTNEVKVEIEITNLTEQAMFVAVNPVGYNGSISSALEVSKDRKSLKILSFLDSKEYICTRPFDVSGVNLKKLLPHSTLSFNYNLPMSSFRAQGTCGLSKELSFSEFESVIVAVGYFTYDNKIEDLIERQIRIHKFDSIEAGKYLPELQKIISISYKIR